MPNLDGTGPMGSGARTGGGFGNCGTGQTDSGQRNDTRLGRGRRKRGEGFGQGAGGGAGFCGGGRGGRGRRNRFYASGETARQQELRQQVEVPEEQNTDSDS